jgi:uncharacterized protein with PIN domain
MTRLLLDAMLGRLATYLRMCGHDTVYTLDAGLETDEEILDRARSDERTLVTRDRDLAAQYPASILLSARDVQDQLAALAAAGVRIGLPETPQRCSRCNDSLVRVDGTEPTPEYAPSTSEFDIWRCEGCGQHFWKGSHWADVAERIADIE